MIRLGRAARLALLTVAVFFGASYGVMAASITRSVSYVPGPLTLTGTLFLPSGHVIDWNSADLTLTHSANTLTLAGGVLVVPSGTAAAPSLAFTGGTTSGLANISAGVDDLDIITNGTARLHLDSARLRASSTLVYSWSSGDAHNIAQDTGLSRSAAGVVAVGTGTQGSTAGTVSAATLILGAGGDITTSGTITYDGITVGSNQGIGIASGGHISFSTSAGAGDSVSIDPQANSTWTSGSGSWTKMAQTFAPASGSGSWANLHINPIINGTSTGTAYGLLLASRTNDMRGGTVKLISAGTSTTDGFTGYTELFALTNHGSMILGSGPYDNYIRAHIQAAMHVDTSFAVGAHMVTIANNGVVATNNEILSGYRSLYLVDCNDPNSCTIQLGTTGIEAGAMTRIFNVSPSANTLTVASVANVQHVASSFTMGTNDVISLQFTRNRSGAGIWIETSRSNN